MRAQQETCFICAGFKEKTEQVRHRANATWDISFTKYLDTVNIVGYMKIKNNSSL